MEQKLGNQYSKDKIFDKTGFRTKARLHQSRFRAEILKVDFHEYGNRLSIKDGLSGLNFYSGFEIFKAVKKRYPSYKKGLYSDMLRSEHIPFNLFIPFNQDRHFCAKIFNYFMNSQIKSIERIEIEYAPSLPENYLNDRTAFDAYIEYTNVLNEKALIGIEVKFTEHEYKLKPKSKEEKDINSKTSLYYSVTKKSNLYHDDALEKLPIDLFRQIWRNHLLGESILQKHENFKYFTSITFFPAGNLHFVEISKQYIKLLKTNNNNFIPITFEAFLKVARSNSPDEKFDNWIKYLEDRYIVN
jgi:hypothetical protein